MKILEEPEHFDKPWTKKHVCILCKAKLLVEEDDILPVAVKETDFRMDSYMVTKYSFRCPCCQKQGFINDNIMPRIVLNRIVNRHNKV